MKKIQYFFMLTIISQSAGDICVNNLKKEADLSVDKSLISEFIASII